MLPDQAGRIVSLSCLSFHMPEILQHQDALVRLSEDLTLLDMPRALLTNIESAPPLLDQVQVHV